MINSDKLNKDDLNIIVSTFVEQNAQLPELGKKLYDMIVGIPGYSVSLFAVKARFVGEFSYVKVNNAALEGTTWDSFMIEKDDAKVYSVFYILIFGPENTVNSFTRETCTELKGYNIQRIDGDNFANTKNKPCYTEIGISLNNGVTRTNIDYTVTELLKGDKNYVESYNNYESNYVAPMLTENTKDVSKCFRLDTVNINVNTILRPALNRYVPFDNGKGPFYFETNNYYKDGDFGYNIILNFSVPITFLGTNIKDISNTLIELINENQKKISVDKEEIDFWLYVRDNAEAENKLIPLEITNVNTRNNLLKLLSLGTEYAHWEADSKTFVCKRYSSNGLNTAAFDKSKFDGNQYSLDVLEAANIWLPWKPAEDKSDNVFDFVRIRMILRDIEAAKKIIDSFIDLENKHYAESFKESANKETKYINEGYYLYIRLPVVLSNTNMPVASGQIAPNWIKSIDTIAFPNEAPKRGNNNRYNNIDQFIGRTLDLVNFYNNLHAFMNGAYLPDSGKYPITSIDILLELLK